MNKRIINVIFLISILVTLAYFINNARIQNSSFFKINDHIENIMMFDKDFNLYLKNSFYYNNFDIIQKKILSTTSELEALKTDPALLLITDKQLKKTLVNLDKDINKKLEIVNRVKSYRAVLNKSFVIVQKIKRDGIHDKLNNLYTIIMTLDKNPQLNILNALESIKKLQDLYKTKNDKFFLKHSKTILTYQIKLNAVNEKLKNLAIEKEIDTFHHVYNNYSQSVIQKAYLSIVILFFLLLGSIIFYLIYDYKLSLSRKELSRFRKTVEDSDNIVIITDSKIRIKYVNPSFTKITGYTSEEVIGKNPRILNSGQQTKAFYNDLRNTIFKGKKWSGRFINKNKKGELTYEKATITPVFDDNNKIVEFVAIKLDITKETHAQEQLIKKEQMLLQQSKMAALGEMLQNIAHQWRQPLSLISTASTGLSVKKELDIKTSKEEDIKILNDINDATQYLSETINAFRDFFNPKKEKTKFIIKDIYKKALNILTSKFKSLEIEIIENIDNIAIFNYDNELIQVFMNLLNNARDVLESKKSQKKLIIVTVYQDSDNVFISVKDSGGGIDEKIIQKVFEPYFTTKHKSQGTGIGLYMCQEIISKHMSGTLTVSNQTFTHQNIEYTGAEFKISIPLT